MSRVAKQPINIPSGVEVNISGQEVSVKGPKGKLQMALHGSVGASLDDGSLSVQAQGSAMAMAGTMRSLLQNLVTGVTDGFEKKLQLIGVGYRAQVEGNKLNLSLGFSHPVEYPVPEGVNVETPSQTEIVVTGVDKQKVGQVAAEIRAYRPPEPYKGKGVRYVDEHVVRKEAKKV